MKYRTAFQCPDTGQTVIAHYAFGRVSITAADYDDLPDDLITHTLAYCKKYRGKRFKTFDAADDYIRRISDGQTFGFEIED